MSQISKLLSGIEINQNVAAESTPIDSTNIYQEFYLPTDIVRGSSDSELRIPQLTGFSVLLNIAEGAKDTIEVDWVIEREVIGTGWVGLDSGTSVGAQAEGEKVWFDIYFNNLLDVNAEMLDSKFRFGIASDDVGSVWHGVASGYLSAYIDA